MARVRRAAESVTIGGVTVAPGARVTIDLPLPRLYTHTPMYMTVHAVSGRRAGARLFVCAALHGDEINGVEIIRRLLRQPALKRLRGTLLAVPIVNVHGFITHTRYLPDRRDLNRTFPGSEKGSLAARMAYLFMEEVVSKCQYGIDLHTGASHRTNLPQIRAHTEDPETERLARAFGAPVILNSNLRDGSLREAAAARGIPTLLYEAGEALRFDELSIGAGVRGIIRVMRALEMLPAGRRRATLLEPVVARSSTWVRAPQSGILRTLKALGARVRKGEVLGTVADPFGVEEVAVSSKVTGIVVGRVLLPLVSEGEALYHIANFESTTAAAARVEAFHSEQEPDLDPYLLDEPPIV